MESGPSNAEQELEMRLAGWFAHLCCLVATKCAAGVHPSVYETLAAGAQSRRSLLQRYWGAVIERHVKVYGTSITMPLGTSTGRSHGDLKARRRRRRRKRSIGTRSR